MPMQKKKILHLVLFEVLLLVVCLLTLVAFRTVTALQEDEAELGPEVTASEALSFATAPGFYEEAITVYLSVPEGCSVYYTFTGEEPMVGMSPVKMQHYSPDTGIVLEAAEGKIKY